MPLTLKRPVGPDQRIIDAMKPNALGQLMDRVETFQKSRFPNQPLDAKFKHLLKEIAELRRATTDRFEWADVLLLFLGCAVASGNNMHADALINWTNYKLQLAGQQPIGQVSPNRPNAFGVLQLRSLSAHRRLHAAQSLDDILRRLQLAAEDLAGDFTNQLKWAQVLYLYLVGAHHIAYSGLELIAHAHEKMDINDKRKWGAPDEHGVVHHID